MSGPSFLLHVDKGNKTLAEFHPGELGLATVNYADLPTGLANHNAVVFLQLLDDEPLAGLRDMVCLNAGLALHCAGAAARANPPIMAPSTTKSICPMGAAGPAGVGDCCARVKKFAGKNRPAQTSVVTL